MPTPLNNASLNDFIANTQRILKAMKDADRKTQQKTLSSLIRDIRDFSDQNPDNAELYFQIGTAIKLIPFATDGQYERMEDSFAKAKELGFKD